jgi:hypothetical protein
MASNFSQAFGYKVYIVPLLSTELDLAELSAGGLGAGKFIDNTAPLSNSAAVTETTTPYGLTVGTTALALDGSDDPLRLLGLTSATLSTDTNSETSLTYDDETEGFSTSIATSKSAVIELAGNANFTDAAYKVLRLCERNSVSKNLMAKLARIGPVGSTETVYGFGRFTGYNENNEAGSIVSWSCSFEFYGPYALDFSS